MESGGKSEAVYALSFVHNKMHSEEKLIPVHFYLGFYFLPSALPTETHTVHVYVKWADALILPFNNYRSPQENGFTEEFYKGFKGFIMKDSGLPQLLVLKGAL